MRAFLARITGDGSKANPYHPDVEFKPGGYIDDGTAQGAQALAWQLFDQADVAVGYLVLADMSAAPVGTADLGDPTDRESMRTLVLPVGQTNAIADAFGVPRAFLQGKTAAQLIRLLVRNQGTITKGALMDGIEVILADETDA